MNKGANKLYSKIKDKNLQLNYLCEVSVFKPEESNILGFIRDGVEALLVEADPNYAQNLRLFFSMNQNAKIIEAATFDYNGTVDLYRRESSTFIGAVESSPALVNDRYQLSDDDKFTAKSIIFSEIDNGNIDLISIDIEGAEWFVLKYMKSRPKVISIETHGKYYINPNINKINQWMDDNSYTISYLEDSDTIFIRNGLIDITTLEKIQLFSKRLKLFIKRQKKFLKKMLGKEV